MEGPDRMHDDLPPTLMQLVSTTEDDVFDVFLQKLKETYDENALATIENLTREQSRCSAWQEYRKGVATSTTCHSFKTRAKNLSKEQRPHNLCGLLKTLLRQRTFQSASMRRGLEDEATAAEKYVECQLKEGHIARVRTSGLVFWDQFPVMACSPDRIVTFECLCCEGRTVVLEIKCPEKLGNCFSKENAKPHFYTQVQVQMGILGMKECDFFVYESAEVFKLLTIPFCKNYFDECVECVRDLYKEYIFIALRAA